MRKISVRLNVAKQMPPLKHSSESNVFDISKSEVVQWLIAQPEIQAYIFDAVRGNKYREPTIIYNSQTGLWQGVDYDNTVFYADDTAYGDTSGT